MNNAQRLAEAIKQLQAASDAWDKAREEANRAVEASRLAYIRYHAAAQVKIKLDERN